ncbi:putative ph response protein [Phaeomoniella chlamydospora]|uniref:Putative ph response protein n=1 Tax=Phaeomoniella chlamydospora TaxID=158046 RepID=A0A0G2DY49_PHACM|nr:putative ph response protein [Phaeomoniella chlamydospora]
MPNDPFLAATSPSILPRGRSLLSRLTNPLASRSRNISEFYIELDDPWRSYGPGDTISGSVVLTVVKPVRITHLVFERGIISYHITSTLTRPVAIAPVTSCERRVQFQDTIDIAPLTLPKPKVISLEPIVKRGRVKNRVVPSSIEQQQRQRGVANLSRTNTEHSMDASNMSLTEIIPPLSPVPSEASTASVATGSSQSFRIVQNQAPSNSGNSVKSANPRSSSSSVSDSVITATTELVRPGGIPGDTIPVKVSVKHTKAIRGIVIVTLYRQGRIDMHPPLPMGPQSKGKTAEYEDVYPKSKTGLGGLHFTSGSPSSVFRKDLSQTTAPMIINPYTLTAEVKASIRVPEDAFPSISNVPGAMISFKYYVEVVIDVCGKLGESRLLDRLSLTTDTNNYASNGVYNQRNNLTSTWADRIIDTDPIRRIKTVVSCVFDVTVGSRDSSRIVRKNSHGDLLQDHFDNPAEDTAERLPGEGGSEDDWRAYYGDDYPYDSYWYDRHEISPHQHHQHHPHHPSEQPVPPPETEENVDEKTRLRRAEEFLLPSQPPQDDDEDHRSSPSVSLPINGTNMMPTAPALVEDDELYGYRGSDISQSDPQGPRPIATAASARSVDTIVPRRPHPSDHPIASPPGFEFGLDINNTATVDDKQELERQRLLSEASAPPRVEDELVEQGCCSSEPSAPPIAQPAVIDVPTAPPLTEEDEYQYLEGERHNFHGGIEHLPQYQR